MTTCVSPVTRQDNLWLRNLRPKLRGVHNLVYTIRHRRCAHHVQAMPRSQFRTRCRVITKLRKGLSKSKKNKCRIKLYDAYVRQLVSGLMGPRHTRWCCLIVHGNAMYARRYQRKCLVRKPFLRSRCVNVNVYLFLMQSKSSRLIESDTMITVRRAG